MTIKERSISIRQDHADVIVCAESYLRTVRCPGGRIIVKGYICVHCGHDPSYGGCKGVTPKIPEKPEKRKRKSDRRKGKK